MKDEVLDKCLKELQATDSLSKRMAIQKKYKITDNDICERCKSAHKFSDLGMCVVVEWCRWDLGYEWFRKERQPQNSRESCIRANTRSNVITVKNGRQHCNDQRSTD